MFSGFHRVVGPALRQVQLLSARTEPRKSRGHMLQIRCAASATFRLLEDCLEINYEGTPMCFNYVWLRDHCRSASSYNSATHQRSLDTGSIELSLRPESSAVEDGQLVLTWPGGHVSKYNLSWLAENSYEGRKKVTEQPRVLWNANIYQNASISAAKWDKFMSCDNELKKFLQHYLLYGIAFVDDVPATVEATEEVTQRVSLIRTTYGRMWSFTSDFSRGDTAYSQLALDRHTDTSYFLEPCGIQVFHCLRHDGTGGRTLLVDGFHAAEKLRQRSSENFELLCRVPIRHEYVENTENHRNHMVGIGPVLNVYPWNNELHMIRYNNYDRSDNTSPMTPSGRWYVASSRAHHGATGGQRTSSGETHSRESDFIDNWRVLMGGNLSPA
ncbi:LOW QUALITY PROTEIN: trimethyllysine dioxygenase, mitochondrial [Anableps anableps]